MASILNAAAQRINASTAGLTGVKANPSLEPGAAHPASATEVADLIPTEFGGLTHLFGGQAAPSTQFQPVTTAKTIPTGSLPGKLGGLVPDARNAVTHAATTATARVKATEPLSVSAKKTIANVRTRLKI
jgi:hypothetical protein